MSGEAKTAVNGAVQAYTSTITMVLDTICPWTYLAFKRLHMALAESNSQATSFRLRFAPYQLHPNLPETGTDKRAWYVENRFGSEERMRAYSAVMSAYGRAAGIEYKFGGQIANSLNSLRAVMWVQDQLGEGGDQQKAQLVLESLYRQYFEEEKSLADRETIWNALAHAGVSDSEATAFLADETLHMASTMAEIRGQEANGIDAVPFITMEGKKRDLHLEGAKEVEQYVKALETIAKENL